MSDQPVKKGASGGEAIVALLVAVAVVAVGWLLSSQAENSYQAQLSSCDAVGSFCAADNSGIYFVAALQAALFALIGGLIGTSKGRGFEGYILGGLLSLLGVIIVLVQGPSGQHKIAAASAEAAARVALYRQCPHCKEEVRRDASTCPHCRSQSDAWTFTDGRWYAHGQVLDDATGTWSAIPTQEGTATV